MSTFFLAIICVNYSVCIHAFLVQEFWDERDGLAGRDEHSLQGEEEQHAGQDTRQEEGLGVPALLPTTSYIIPLP